jgi:hypothetical protein
MPGTVETLSTLNSVVRTILAVIVVGAVAGGGWLGYRAIEGGHREARLHQEALETARRDLAEKERLLLEQDVRAGLERIEQLQTAMSLLKVDKRVARLTVLDQSTDPQTRALLSTVQFVELDERGEPIGEPRVVTIEGAVVYVDNWIVKFDERYVEAADELRSASLVLFRRFFGERQQPDEGFPIDRVGARPDVYSRGEPLSDFERRIWGDFWEIANDPQRAAGLGIRAAHGEAVSMKLQKGRSYRLVLRASDGLSIIPDTGRPM